MGYSQTLEFLTDYVFALLDTTSLTKLWSTTPNRKCTGTPSRGSDRPSSLDTNLGSCLTGHHRRRLKELKFGSYTKEEAERTAGRGVDNKQRGVEPIVLKKKEDQDLEMEGQDSKTASTTTTAQETAVSS